MSGKFKKVILLSLFWALTSVSNAANLVVGRWLDDLGSPDFLDAQLSIVRDGSKYYLERHNGDGSLGRFRLEKQVDKDRYIKTGDKFGAVYEITPDGLDIYDMQGFIRQAKKQ